MPRVGFSHFQTFKIFRLLQRRIVELYSFSCLVLQDSYRHPIQTCNFSFFNVFLWKIHFPTRNNEWKLSKSHCTMCTKYLHGTRDKRDRSDMNDWIQFPILKSSRFFHGFELKLRWNIFSFSGFPFQDWRSRNRNRNWLSIFRSLMSSKDSLARTTTTTTRTNKCQIPVLTFNTRQNRPSRKEWVPRRARFQIPVRSTRDKTNHYEKNEYYHANELDRKQIKVAQTRKPKLRWNASSIFLFFSHSRWNSLIIF